MKSPVIELPVKVTLTSEGIEWFIKHKRQLKRLRMADNSIEYGISLNNFTATSLQKMINIDYISAVELARTEFASKRQEIIDLSKLIVYRILYKRFETEAFKIFLNSPLIKRWNRANPARTINEDSTFNHQYVENFLLSVASDIPKVSKDIQEPLFIKIEGNFALSDEERKIQFFLSDRYMVSMPNIMWCILVKSRTQPEYAVLILELRSLLEEHIEKARIAEYLALMIMELLTFTEKYHYLGTGEEMFPEDKHLSTRLVTDRKFREAVQKRMQENRDYLYLNFQISGRGPSIGTQHRLRVILFNREREYRRVKQQIENSMDLDLQQRTLSDFYNEGIQAETDPELGLYYLSYLNDECTRQNVRFDSNVSEIPKRDLTIISLTLQF